MKTLAIPVFVLCLAWSGLAVPSGAVARTIVVRPDGSGDYPTIQAAVDAAVSGDVIELASGTFTGPGNRDVSMTGKSIVIRSQSGDPASCIIDCQHAGRAFDFHGDIGTSTVTGVTMTGGSSDWGAAIYDDSSGGITLTDCVLSRNTASSVAAGVYSHASPRFTRCSFVENSAGEAAGAFCCGSTSGASIFPVFEECGFIRNTAGYTGGAIVLDAVEIARADRQASFIRCTFEANESPRGAAVALYGMSPALDHCTFFGNSAPVGGVIDCGHSTYTPSNPQISNTILAFSTAGPAILCDTGCFPVLRCCDVYGNAGGDWVGCIEDQLGQDGNISADPLFCDPADHDFHLAEHSPCAPGQNPDCGLIGAWPVGCTSVPVVPLTWGALKLRYR